MVGSTSTNAVADHNHLPWVGRIHRATAAFPIPQNTTTHINAQQTTTQGTHAHTPRNRSASRIVNVPTTITKTGENKTNRCLSIHGSFGSTCRRRPRNGSTFSRKPRE